jgi:predicted secreted hydrolase
MASSDIQASNAAAGLSIPTGVGPLIDASKTLTSRVHTLVDTWFVTGHFKANGHRLNYFYHVIIMPGPDGNTIFQTDVSITDETDGWFSATDEVIPFEDNLANTGVDSSGRPTLAFSRSVGGISLTFDKVHVTGNLPDGAFDIQMVPIGPVLYYGGTGTVPVLGTVINEYAVPRMKSTGTITIKDKVYKVDGNSWLDREWQDHWGDLAARKWSWMSINLDNGDSMMLYSAPDGADPAPRGWATILHADGTQTTTAIDPSLGATDVWVSPNTGNRYPTRWSVKIPALDAVLEVVPSPREQEFISVMPALSKYEGASAIGGTYRGKPVTGSAYVELYGDWRS